jgi:hypothetical protein
MVLEIRKTENKGFGLFTTQNIEKGQLVVEIKGEIKTEEEWIKLGADDNYLHQIDWDKYMLVEPPARFTNHSCNPNCGFKNRTKFYALRNIEKGEEITADYDTFESNWVMKCRCGEKNCRGTIRGFNHLPQEIKDRYVKLGIVAKYLVKK